jgi:hypothetical protein
MKKILFTLLTLGLLIPATYNAATTTSSGTEFFTKKSKKKKAYKQRKPRKYYSQNNNCTYNGHQLFVGKRGGCYYYSGDLKEYVDRSYCSGCN